MNRTSNDSLRNPAILILGVWFLAALGIGASGTLSRFPRPGIQILLALLTFLLLFFFFRSQRFRQWVLNLDVRWLVALHLCRFVGFYFLWLYSSGELPYAFAVPGG